MLVILVRTILLGCEIQKANGWIVQRAQKSFLNKLCLSENVDDHLKSIN